jgi:hypothetical protein
MYEGAISVIEGELLEFDASHVPTSGASTNCDRKNGIRYRVNEKRGADVSAPLFPALPDYLMKNVFRSARPCVFVKTYPPTRDATNSRMFRFSYTASGACAFWTVKSRF